MIAVTSPSAVRSVSSETTLSETIVLIVPGIRFRMLVLMGSRFNHRALGVVKRADEFKAQSDCLGQRDYLLAVNIGLTKSEISAQREIVKRDSDPSYVRGLKARLLSVKNQLKNMSGNNGSQGADDW